MQKLLTLATRESDRYIGVVDDSNGHVFHSGVNLMSARFGIARARCPFSGRRLVMVSFMLFILNNAIIADESLRMQLRRSSTGVPYGIIQRETLSRTPAPTLFIVANTFDAMQKELVYTEVARLLAPQGWVSVILEPPCHGEDARDDEPGQLDGWRYRIEHDGPFLEAFNARATAVLDELIQQKLTDPNRVAACGTSRGGFVAYHFAAAEPRIRAVAGISPVTRLNALREFSTTEHPEKVEPFNAIHLAPKLTGKAVWLSIGNNDARVNTDDAIAFTRAVVNASAAAASPDARIPVDLFVARSSGHSKVDQAHELLAGWLQDQLPEERR